MAKGLPVYLKAIPSGQALLFQFIGMKFPFNFVTFLFWFTSTKITLWSWSLEFFCFLFWHFPHRIFSKVWESTLKQYLPHIIKDYQSGFINIDCVKWTQENYLILFSTWKIKNKVKTSCLMWRKPIFEERILSYGGLLIWLNEYIPQDGGLLDGWQSSEFSHWNVKGTACRFISIWAI